MSVGTGCECEKICDWQLEVQQGGGRGKELVF